MSLAVFPKEIPFNHTFDELKPFNRHMSSVKRSVRHICECFTALYAAVSLTFNGIDCSFYLIFTEANDISGLTMGAGVAVFVFLF